MNTDILRDPSVSTLTLRRRIAEWEASGDARGVLPTPPSLQGSTFREDVEQLRVDIQDTKKKIQAIDAKLADALRRQRRSASSIMNFFEGFLRLTGIR